MNSTNLTTGTARSEPEAYLYLEHNFGWMVVAAVVIGAASIIGTLGNVLIILSICCVRILRTPCNIFILNLALADMVVTLLVDPFNVVGPVAARQVLLAHPLLCQWIASFCAPACLSSMWNMAAISVNRYVFICQPRLYPQIFTFRNSILICIGIWALAHLLHMPNHIGWGQGRFSFEYFLCTFDTIVYSYDVFYITTGVIIPLCGVLFGYTAIFLKVRSVKHRIRIYKREALIRQDEKHKQDSTMPKASPPITLQCMQEASPMHGAQTKQRIQFAGFNRDDVRLAKTLFAAFFVFLCSWFLLVLFNLAGNPHTVPGFMYVIAMILAHGNSAVNPILYGVANKSFRDGYSTVLRLNRHRRTVWDVKEASKPHVNVASSGSWALPTSAPVSLSLRPVTSRCPTTPTRP